MRALAAAAASPPPLHFALRGCTKPSPALQRKPAAAAALAVLQRLVVCGRFSNSPHCCRRWGHASSLQRRHLCALCRSLLRVCVPVRARARICVLPFGDAASVDGSLHTWKIPSSRILLGMRHLLACLFPPPLFFSLDVLCSLCSCALFGVSFCYIACMSDTFPLSLVALLVTMTRITRSLRPISDRREVRR